MSEDTHALQAPTREYSEEELNAAGAEARGLMEKSRQVNCTAQMLCYSRQLYNIGKVMLQEAVQVQEVESPEVVFSAIVRSMNNMAHTQENTSEAMIKKLTELVIPLLAMQHKSVVDQVIAEEKVEAKTADTARREQMISLGSLSDAPLPRTTTLTLVGHPAVLHAAMSHIRKEALLPPDSPQKFATVVIRLLSKMSALDEYASGKDLKSVDIGASRWINSAGTWKKFDKMLFPWLRRTKGQRVDLLLVENAFDLLTSYIAGATDAQRAAAAHKALRKWANASGTGMVIGLPTEKLVPVYPAELGWTELFEHTRTVGLSAVPAAEPHTETHYDIIWTEREGPTSTVLSVAREAVDNCRETNDAE